MELRLSTGRQPSVAEWDSGLLFEGALAEIVTPIHGESLQLTDHSFDVVIAGATHKSSAEEALRVATQAIGICQSSDERAHSRSSNSNRARNLHPSRS